MFAITSNSLAAYEDDVFCFAARRTFTTDQTDKWTESTFRQTDRLKSNQNLILIKTMYTLWRLKCYVLSVAYVWTKRIYLASFGDGYKKSYIYIMFSFVYILFLKQTQ